MKKCVNCNLNFCEKCLRKIHKNKAFLSHVLIDPSSCVEDQIKCFFHPFTNLRHYCIQDKLPICDECKLSTHRNHRLYSLDLAFQCEIAEMQKNVSQFTEVKVNFEKCIQQMKLMKNDMEQNEIQRNAEVSKEFVSLHEALKVQEQAIKDMIKVETTKKQNEVDQFFESASASMLRLEGLMLYAMEACKESRPAIFLQTSAQINKRLADITLCVTPSNSLAVIPFEDFELNVDHIKDAIETLPSQLCETKSKHLCSGDFQMIQRLDAPYKVKKLKAACSLQEASLNPMYSSFTSKIHAALITPNLDLCSCITRSCAVTFNSDASNVDSRADVPASLPCGPRYASEDSLSVSSTKTALNDRASPEHSPSTSKAETTSDATDGGSCTHGGKSNALISDASSLDYCESVANSEHYAPENSSEPQAETDYNLSCTSDPHASNIFQSAYFKNCDLKGASSALYNPVAMEPSSSVFNMSMEGECNDKSQESNQFQKVPEKTSSLWISEKTRPIPIWQLEQEDCYMRQSSGDAFSLELSPKGTGGSSNACSPEPENSKYLNDHESGDLSKDPMSSVISEQVAAESDTGISSSCNSSCLSSEKETDEYVPPFYQFCVPCTFTNTNTDTGPPQADCANSGPEDDIDGEKGVPISICVNESLSPSEQSYHACNTFSCVGTYFATGHNLPCKNMNPASERESSEIIAAGCQMCHLSSSAGCMIDWDKREMYCLHKNTSNNADSAVVDDASISNPTRSWNTTNVPRNTRSRCKFGRRPSFRNPKLFSKGKAFLRGYPKPQTLNNVQFTPSACCQSQSTSNFEISSNMSNEDLGNSRVLYLPRGTTDDSVKGHSSTRFYHIGGPKSRNFRSVHRTCSHLRPQNNAVHKTQQHVCTLERNVTVKRDNGEMSQLSVQLHASSLLKEPMTALDQLPGPPKIYTHTVDGTSAKVKWMCPPVGKRTAYFFELQFQEIISVDKEMAIPQDQAGVFSGIRRRNFVATNLNSNSEYLFRVRAVNVSGEGPWSQPYKILTVCGTVRNSGNTKDKTVSLKGVKVTIHRSN
ncbi:uncharacterized protein LOC129703709 [Leucoraja erinacea]|uniref:uncharacterized protein LOC129703709 n=1 Tax=Leucoraja erinaceus TaxID=7782 RepID=UPI00245792D0|nr:uncharacterized protein LOC129703709 [Leucoraja erinacea]